MHYSCCMEQEGNLVSKFKSCDETAHVESSPLPANLRQTESI